ncbi:hypothetical protein FACS1894154_03590 [Betaproteobacteria bacterium]|nr:hypothetical protein FACS1894154_03590 [Betaproteobacteria bacterium]
MFAAYILGQSEHFHKGFAGVAKVTFAVENRNAGMQQLEYGGVLTCRQIFEELGGVEVIDWHGLGGGRV